MSSKRLRRTLAGTALVISATALAAPPAAASVPAVVDQTVSNSGSDVSAIESPAVTVEGSRKTVIALVAADGPQGSRQNLSVSGCGLRWRGAGGEIISNVANDQAGAVSVYYAVTTGPLTGCTVSGSLAQPGYAAMITVAVVSGAANTLRFTSSGAPDGAAAATVSAPLGALVLAVGNDWDSATRRTVLPGQEIVHEVINTDIGDSFWVQRLTGSVEQDGPVTVGTSAPTDDQWNFVTVTVPPAV